MLWQTILLEKIVKYWKINTHISKINEAFYQIYRESLLCKRSVLLVLAGMRWARAEICSRNMLTLNKNWMQRKRRNKTVPSFILNALGKEFCLTLWSGDGRIIWLIRFGYGIKLAIKFVNIIFLTFIKTSPTTHCVDFPNHLTYLWSFIVCTMCVHEIAKALFKTHLWET